MNRIVSYVLVLLAGLSAGYWFNINQSKTVETVQQAEIGQRMPECFAGQCPEYQSMDVDGDNLAESAVVVHTRMTQGAGKVWIIDEGKKVFESEELMRVWIYQTQEQVDEGNGFIIIYGTEPNNNVKGKKRRYFYQDGKFVPDPVEVDVGSD